MLNPLPGPIILATNYPHRDALGRANISSLAPASHNVRIVVRWRHLSSSAPSLVRDRDRDRDRDRGRKTRAMPFGSKRLGTRSLGVRDHINTDSHIPDSASGKSRVKNINLFIADGMGTSTWRCSHSIGYVTPEARPRHARGTPEARRGTPRHARGTGDADIIFAALTDE
jgi:hypothetical protein